ncbi:MAG: TonB-dependent receptor [Bacilli bacterium]|nr:TonB-dependent receptor [Bacilli bacterium]
MKKKSPSKILFKLGCALCGVAIVAFVVSSFLLLFRTDGTNMVGAAFNAFISGITSLFGSGERGGAYTYACIGLGVAVVFVTVYFAIIFSKAKKASGVVAAILACLDMVIVVFVIEAALLSLMGSGAPIRIRGYGGLLITAVPVALSLISLVVYQIVAFADVAGDSKEDIDRLQKEIDELKEQIANLKVAPVVAEEPKEEVVEDKDVETVVDQETGITYIVRYNKSYEAKITLASKEVQDYYNEVKNYILSFGANSRVSWNYDAFNVGRNTVAKLNITGKTLSVYLDLNPANYVDSKYHAKDVSKSKKYAQTPTQMKIKSARGVKFAKELVDEVMKVYGKTSDGSVAGDFHAKPQSFKKLMDAGLIKQSRSLAKPVAPAKK